MTDKNITVSQNPLSETKIYHINNIINTSKLLYQFFFFFMFLTMYMYLKHLKGWAVI